MNQTCLKYFVSICLKFQVFLLCECLCFVFLPNHLYHSHQYFIPYTIVCVKVVCVCAVIILLNCMSYCALFHHKLQSLLFLEGSISTVAPNGVGSSSGSGEFLAENAGLGTNGKGHVLSLEPSSQ